MLVWAKQQYVVCSKADQDRIRGQILAGQDELQVLNESFPVAPHG